MPAILKRPPVVLVESARPSQQRVETAPPNRDGLLAEQLARPGCDRGDHVRTLVSVRAEHDH
jgi:hypothetical protein